MHCLIAHDDSKGLAFYKIWSLTSILLCVYNSEGSGKSTYTYAQAHLSLRCSTLRLIPNSNGLIPLICSFVTSKSIFFLNMQSIIRLQFYSNDNVHI